MPQFYKRKSGVRAREEIDEVAMSMAIKEYFEPADSTSEPKLSLRAIAEKYNLKKSTLDLRIQKVKKNRENGSTNTSGLVGDGLDRSKYSINQVFSNNEENSLKDYVLRASVLYYGITPLKLRKLAYQYSVLLNRTVPEKWHEDKKASIAWYKGFMHRNPTLSLRKPENTSLARIKAMNYENITTFFDNYRDLRQKFNFPENRIYNFDESGISTVLPSPKIIAKKGQKQVGQISSAERGAQLTFGAFINAMGQFIPPVYIFPDYLRSRKKGPIRIDPISGKDVVVGAPENSLGLFSKRGWMVSELFVKVLIHFREFTQASCNNPVHLLLDNHSSLCSLESIKYAKENDIELLTFPPHLTHRLQPLDVGLFGPFKSLMRHAMKDMIDDSKTAIDLCAIPQISTQPFLRAFVPENILNAFKKAGLSPVNRLVFSDILLDENTESTPATPKTPDDLVNLNNSNIVVSVDNNSSLNSSGHSSSKNSELLDSINHLTPVKNGVSSKRAGKSTCLTSTPEIKIKEAKEEIKKSKGIKKQNRVKKNLKFKPVKKNKNVASCSKSATGD